MLSSMTPTIVFDNDEPFLAIGSPGGSRIITAVLQIILTLMEEVLDQNIAPDQLQQYLKSWEER